LRSSQSVAPSRGSHGASAATSKRARFAGSLGEHAGSDHDSEASPKSGSYAFESSWKSLMRVSS
jgi:hypothetical protein